METKEFIVTPEIMQFAELVAERAIAKVLKSKISVRERSYLINDAKIFEAFPDLTPRRLKEWAYNGKVGMKGRDNKYHVKLSEIEKYLFCR
ncbi:MAG: hypothetical protein J7604_03610 [Sporocytophaga sp.]|uniref:hypothetical protein n=1 Tax=Sporocytophaga sp. TaxID=2231183 RepID=UPI001B12B49A|nr:hypothetical protein [Sporocytophaga sp.]MBO9699268.1 hypothetical protein [Sporocytophaga sp.]